jgi:hypothetical protein
MRIFGKIQATPQLPSINESNGEWIANKLPRWPTSSNRSSMPMASMSVANNSDLPNASASSRRFVLASPSGPPWPLSKSTPFADWHRQFNEWWQMETDYQAFHKPLDQSTAPVCFLDSLCDMMSPLTRKVWGFEASKAFSDFHRLLLQEGRSFALHKALAHVFPGRFHPLSPAAVELHSTLDWLQDAPITSAWSPDTDSEHDSRPEPESLRGDLLLADRGYLDLTYLRDLERHGGFLMVRGKSHLNPMLTEQIGRLGIDCQRDTWLLDRRHLLSMHA